MTEMEAAAPRIAIPVPHSGDSENDREYAERVLPQYEAAVRGAGGEPVRVELDQTPVRIMQQIERCDAVLLPVSPADAAGDGLRVVARSTEDGIIEALEVTAPGHFVLAVQWHPERSVNDGPEVAESAHAIFRAFIQAARARHAEL